MKPGKRSAEVHRAGYGTSAFRIPQVPIEWLDGQSWRLPSGKALAEFALQKGFIAPLLMKVTMFGGQAPLASKKQARHTVAPGESR